MIKTGDIIGFSGACWQSDLINVATFGVPRWSLSHVGIIGPMNDGRLQLVESTAETGVVSRNFWDRIESYDGRIWHYPLNRELYAHESRRLVSFLRSHLGEPYDYIGALGASGFGWKAYLHADSLASIYCSALCAAGHTAVGIFQTSRPDRWSPNLFVRTERAAGILGKPQRLK